ncbi:MAG: hypothetical protein ACR2IS_00705 [Nitrososphaeraceae archaeon]
MDTIWKYLDKLEPYSGLQTKMNRINNIIKPILKRQLLIMGIGVALCFLVSYFFGFLIGFMANTLFFVCFTFYIRRIDSNNRRTNLVNYRRAVNIGKFTADDTTRVKYICLSCGAEFRNKQCSICGSKFRKPLF